jgi:hypothetical protein
MIDRVDFVCDTCHNEIIIDMTVNPDVMEEDIKYCCFCGSKLDQSADLSELDMVADGNIEWDE